jgi:hypothetical protein
VLRPALEDPTVAEMIPLTDLHLDFSLQLRVKVSQDAIRQYEQVYRDGGPDALPPLKAIRLQDGYCYVYDGFHRHEAARRAALTHLPCETTEGDMAQARRLARASNRDHGLRLSRRDRQRMIEMALEEHPDWSDRAIAEECGVHNETVGAVRKRLTKSVTPRRGKDGKTYTVRERAARAPAKTRSCVCCWPGRQ